MPNRTLLHCQTERGWDRKDSRKPILFESRSKYFSCARLSMPRWHAVEPMNSGQVQTPTIWLSQALKVFERKQILFKKKNTGLCGEDRIETPGDLVPSSNPAAVWVIRLNHAPFGLASPLLLPAVLQPVKQGFHRLSTDDARGWTQWTSMIDRHTLGPTLRPSRSAKRYKAHVL